VANLHEFSTAQPRLWPNSQSSNGRDQFVGADGILHHRYLVPKLDGVSHGRFNTGVRDEPHDNQLVDAVPLGLQVQVRVGETA
jgi:hypothetical protein